MSVYGAPSSLPAQRACKMAIGPACGGPLGEMPGAKATPILTDSLEQFGTSEAIRSWNSLEHLKLRGLRTGLLLHISFSNVNVVLCAVKRIHAIHKINTN